jgi:hypothetical protein
MAQAVQFACSLFASRRPKDRHALLTPTAASPRGPSLVSRKHIEPFLNHQELFPHGVLRAHPAVGAIVGLFKIWKIERRAGAMVASPIADRLFGKAVPIGPGWLFSGRYSAGGQRMLSSAGGRGDRPVDAACMRHRPKLPLFLLGKQRSIAARCGGVDRHDLFERKTV